MTIEEMSNFEVRNIKANLETYFLKLDLKLKAVQAKGNYSMDGKLLKIFPLSGHGQFSINLTNAEIYGVGKLYPAEGTLQMKKLELDLSWKKLDAYLENFLGGGKFSEVLQRILPNVGKKAFDSYKPQILNHLNTLLIKELNKMFKKPEVKAIVEGFVST